MDKVCGFCGIEFHIPRYRMMTAKYCSLQCRNEAYRGQSAQYIPPRTKQTIFCSYCRQAFEIVPSRRIYGRGKYCSRTCQYAAARERPKNAKEFICLNCHKKFLLSPSRVAKPGAGKYCSHPCRSIHRVGTNHPQYINGSASENRGPNWQSQKRKARKRDKEVCQDCGRSNSRDVHHIVPFRIFGIEQYKIANQLSNLVTLCHPCHRKRDIQLQRLERMNR